ncbi:MAG: hypothetical protein WCJ04_11450 [Actinomycetes bacterium]
MGFLLFALFGLLLIGVFFVLLGRRRDYDANETEADKLSDADFRRIEFGDEDI